MLRYSTRSIWIFERTDIRKPHTDFAIPTAGNFVNWYTVPRFGERNPPFFGFLDGQHPVNWAYDTLGDLLANTIGQICAVFVIIGFDILEVNKVTLMIPGPNYSDARRQGSSDCWTELAPPGATFPY